jgi:hypothetical protein
MIKLTEKDGIKQVYSDSPGNHGKAEMMAFLTIYVQEVNKDAGLWLLKETRKEKGAYYYMDLFGKYKETVNQTMLDKFNAEVRLPGNKICNKKEAK